MIDPSGVWIIYNGEFYRAGSPVLTVSNRGFRYGDGLFETMLVQNGRIRLEDFHFDRLFTAMRLLHFEVPDHFTRESLAAEVHRLCGKNGDPGLSRIRLVVFRGPGHLFDTADNFPHYVIECSALGAEEILLNNDGLRIGVYPDGRKACDRFANLKSGNFLLYAQAARYARARGWDDCLVLNGYERVADSCIANLFYIRDGVVRTPPLAEGCVAGVMRRFLLDRLPGWGFPVREEPVSPEYLAGADELFLTNAVRAIRWVGDFAGRVSHGRLARELYDLVVKEA